MAIDFPNTPTSGDVYTVGDRSWKYDGVAWKATTSPGSNYLPLTGGTITGTLAAGATTITGTLAAGATTITGTLVASDATGDVTTQPSGGIEIRSTTYNRNLAATQYSTTAGPILRLARSTSATLGANAAVVSGDDLGIIRLNGNDGTAFFSGSEIAASAAETWTSTARGATVRIKNIRLGENVLDTRIGVTGNGGTQFAGWTDALADIRVDQPNVSIRGFSQSQTSSGIIITTADISGTTLNVTAVTGTPIKVGQRVLNSSNLPAENTAGVFIVALLTGTGGTGTYQLSTSFGTVTSRTFYLCHPTIIPSLRFYNTTLSTIAGDQLGSLEWWGSDTNGNGTRAFISASTTDTLGSTALSFGAGVAAVGGSLEKMRLDGAGLLSGTGTSLGGWTAYTPTLGGTGWALGNGSVTNSAYCQIGKIVFFRMSAVFGSTSTYGTVQPTFTVPVAERTAIGLIDGSLSGWAVDASASAKYPIQALVAVGTGLIQVSTGAQPTASVTSTVPFTWTTSDSVNISGFYEAA